MCLRGLCGQWRLRSACADAHADRSLRCPLTDPVDTEQRCPISFHGCAGWFRILLAELPWNCVFVWRGLTEGHICVAGCFSAQSVHGLHCSLTQSRISLLHYEERTMLVDRLVRSSFFFFFFVLCDIYKEKKKNKKKKTVGGFHQTLLNMFTEHAWAPPAIVYHWLTNFRTPSKHLSKVKMCSNLKQFTWRKY